jgi:hypothetical protein
MAGAHQRPLDRRGDESLRGAARWKIEGRTDRAIAARLGGVEEAVGRRPRAIRRPRSEEVRP